MARGMDVPEVDLVVNYDVPVYTRTYIHRVGRTARAGKNGRAFTIAQRKEVRRPAGRRGRPQTGAH
jgi:superfamily II DNA/RNA helicase